MTNGLKRLGLTPTPRTVKCKASPALGDSRDATRRGGSGGSNSFNTDMASISSTGQSCHLTALEGCDS